MLTQEIIRADAALSQLTDEQVNAIAELSRNDEAAVIAKKTGDIYGALDNDILEASGIKKNGTEKTYDYARRVLGELKGSSATMQGQIDALTKDKERLEKAIADGDGGAALKQAKADLSAITKQYNELNDRYAQAEETHRKELFSAKVDYELQAAASSLKFKAGLPQSVTRVITSQAAERVKAMNPEEIDDGNGGRVLAFKDKDGAIMRNPNNKLNPYTASEMLVRELESMDVLDKGRRQTGTGTRPPHANGAGGIDISGAKTRVEAEAAIRKSLLSQGMTVGSDAYQQAMDKAWKDFGVSKLPER